MKKLCIDDFNFNEKKVLLRCDFNVPVKNNEITDDTRILESIPTIRKLLKDGAKIIICAHMGKPKGEPNSNFSLKIVADRLGEILQKKIFFSSEDFVVGEKARKMAASLKNGDVMLLENTRFRKEETENGDNFSRELSELADVFVNDAFGASHRAHSSTVGVTKFIKMNFAGFLIKKEMDVLTETLENPIRPFAAIMGGAKVSDKITAIYNLLDKVDILMIGGGMAYTFLKAKGLYVGNSIVDETKVSLAEEFMAKALKKGVELVLPTDVVVVKKIDEDSEIKIVESNKIPSGLEGVDIGPETIERYKKVLRSVKTVIWNGPMGVFEIEKFANGTNEIAKTLVEFEYEKTIVGGGDSAAAIAKLGLKEKITHISTGGGALLQLLSGEKLPGIESLNDKK